jgi:hypothetical protein
MRRLFYCDEIDFTPQRAVPLGGEGQSGFGIKEPGTFGSRCLANHRDRQQKTRQAGKDAGFEMI